MATKADTQAHRWINLFIWPVSILVSLFHGTEQGLSSTSFTFDGALFLERGTASRKTATQTVTHCGLNKLLHLLMISILEGYEALGDLEEVAVGLERSELYIEYKGAICSDLLLCRSHFKRVFDKVLSCLV